MPMIKVGNKRFQTDGMDYDALLDLKEEIDDQLVSIKTQISEAMLLKNQGGGRANPQWWHNVNSAKTILGRQSQKVQREIGKRKRENARKNDEERIARGRANALEEDRARELDEDIEWAEENPLSEIFMEVAKGMIDSEKYESIMKIATKRKEIMDNAESTDAEGPEGEG